MNHVLIIGATSAIARESARIWAGRGDALYLLGRDAGRLFNFITGYAENAVFNHGHIERGMEVLTKPFAVDDLTGRVARLLGP